jgi:hypothetical protein
LPRQVDFFAIRKPPYDVAVGSSVINKLGNGFIEIEHDAKLAVSVQSGIIEIVVTRPGRILRLYFREPFSNSLCQSLRGTVSFFASL